ncbi:Thymidylate kinase [Candidatus Protochlamydia naegleriophila]|uniref:Thymidylate kinase n=1 Tax=Candidatus Protochlamydia naegleriophila TaxID=389348 RepID=A0A0U5JCQ2_9BACT|nr:dTMP kinase [Candidatus Protochlamydia naegleriophila]CUI16434.1 Thymidylate kinase [Candidatus Protochlamydia naegleriophila]
MTKTLSKGYFITIEGGEGSGKSTLLKQLAEHLQSCGYEVVQTREPGGSKLGESIRSWLLNCDDAIKIGHQAELLLFLAARAQHIEELIKPALDAGKIVLCDRFNDSTIAYQGAARGLDHRQVQQFCNLVCGDVLPQLTLFLDVAPEVGLQRTQRLQKEHAQAGELDRIESEKVDFHQRVREAFQALAKREPLRIYRIDASHSQAGVLKEAIRAMDELILFPNHKARA